MEFINWLLAHLPITYATPVVVFGLSAWLIKLLTPLTWNATFRSKKFILASTLFVYTEILLGAIQFVFLPDYLGKELGPFIGTTSKLPDKIKKFRVDFFDLNLIVVEKQLHDSRLDLYENLQRQKEYSNRKEPVPLFLLKEQARLKGNIDSFESEVTKIKKRRNNYSD